MVQIKDTAELWLLSTISDPRLALEGGREML